MGQAVLGVGVKRQIAQQTEDFVTPMQPHEFRQQLSPRSDASTDGPFAGYYPAPIDETRELRLPIRVLPDGDHALCSLIVNQASFEVLDALAAGVAQRLERCAPEVIVGLPTLGLTLADAVARRLGHTRYVACGTSRKFWYEERLSVPVTSVTTPDEKRLYLDPRMLPLIEGRRVVLIDDVVSTGRSIVAGLALLRAAGVEPVAVACAMLQSQRWRDHPELVGMGDRLVSVLVSPRLCRSIAGWVAE
jgi:adenine/guanine phosphoribosyltransferase-like PRPP-binding protein